MENRHAAAEGEPDQKNKRAYWEHVHVFIHLSDPADWCRDIKEVFAPVHGLPFDEWYEAIAESTEVLKSIPVEELNTVDDFNQYDMEHDLRVVINLYEPFNRIEVALKKLYIEARANRLEKQSDAGRPTEQLRFFVNLDRFDPDRLDATRAAMLVKLRKLHPLKGKEVTVVEKGVSKTRPMKAEETLAEWREIKAGDIYDLKAANAAVRQGFDQLDNLIKNLCNGWFPYYKELMPPPK